MKKFPAVASSVKVPNLGRIRNTAETGWGIHQLFLHGALVGQVHEIPAFFFLNRKKKHRNRTKTHITIHLFIFSQRKKKINQNKHNAKTV